jgi:hypothetical protein
MPARSKSPKPRGGKRTSGKVSKKMTFLSRLKTAMIRYPLLVNSSIAAAINAAAIMAAQAIEGDLGSNWTMVTIFGLIGAFVITPLVLRVLIGVVFKMRLSKLQLLCACTIFGTLIITPAFEISLAFLSALFDNENDMCLKTMIKDIFHTIFSQKFLALALQSRLVFFPADVLNIYIIPPSYAPIVSNIAGFLWTIVLAFKSKA